MFFFAFMYFSTPILGSPRVVQNTRAYSNTSSNNDGAKDKPKTRTQIAQNERGFISINCFILKIDTIVIKIVIY